MARLVVVRGDITTLDVDAIVNAPNESLGGCETVKTIAFPTISAGIYGYPIAEATRIAVEMCGAAESARVEEVRFVAFNEDTYQGYLAAGATAI